MGIHLYLALALIVSDLYPGFVSLFLPREYSYTGGEYQSELFHYRLFVPDLEQGTLRYPLIVWLHGAGESGHDNEWHLRWLDQLILQVPWERQHYRFFVLSVQCPEHNSLWFRAERPPVVKNGPANSDDMIDVVFAILNATIADYPVDTGRIYLSGVSSGGTGCWEFAIRHQDLFAAVAPLGSTGSRNPDLKSLVGVPIWAFHSNNDERTPIHNVRETVQSLQRLGGNVHLTEIESNQHDCWTEAFHVYDILDWLLSQRRHAPGPPPGTVPTGWRIKTAISNWQWWQIILEAGVVGLIVGGTALLFVRIRKPRVTGSQIGRELPSMEALIKRY